MMNQLTDQLEKVKINQCLKEGCADDSCPTKFEIKSEEVHSIYSSLMAAETDKSEKTQCRCAVIASVRHHNRSRRRHGANEYNLHEIDPRLDCADKTLTNDYWRTQYYLPQSPAGNCYNACEALKIAARIAFEYNLDDPVLADLFRALYECNGSFAELLTAFKDVKAIEYFLEQSTRLKLLFPVQNEKKPMLECPLNRTYSTFRPIEGAIDNERFDALELMIRYGACLEYETAFGDQISVAQMALDLVFQCYYHESDKFVDRSKLPSYMRFLVLVLRAVPHVTYPMPQRFRDQSMFACPDAVTDNKRAMFRKLIGDGVISAAHAGKEPPGLKHLAKIAVRAALYRAWYLPRGIFMLGLPGSMEEYLDLKTD